MPTGQPLAHYLGELQKRGYVWGEDWLPHDAKTVTLGTGKSIEELMRAAARRVRITPKLSVADGINAARTIFNPVLVRSGPLRRRRRGRSATTAATPTPAARSGKRRCTTGPRTVPTPSATSPSP
jgi:hypothetical protein